jgi:hypothetical protein
MGLLVPLLRVRGKAPGRDAGRLRSQLYHLRHFDELGSDHAVGGGAFPLLRAGRESNPRPSDP